MKRTKFILRIFVTILLCPIMYPALVISYSFFGLIIMLGVSEALTYLLHWLGNNKEGMNDAKEGFYMTVAPFYLPFLIFRKYILTGILDTHNPEKL